MRPFLLDLDDTLLDDRAATAVAFEAFVAAHRGRLREAPTPVLLERWRAVAREHWLRHERGEATFQEQRRLRVRAFLEADLDDADADRAFEPYRRAYESSWRLGPGVARFLARSKGIPKIILTNGDREQQLRKVESTGLTAHVAAVITPADCGCWKPTEGMFLAGARTLGVAPERCIMIGDDPARDLEPAAQLGMACFQVEHHHVDEAFDAALEASLAGASQS